MEDLSGSVFLSIRGAMDITCSIFQNYGYPRVRPNNDTAVLFRTIEIISRQREVASATEALVSPN